VQVVDRQLCVCELEEALGLPQSTLSSHLAVLKKGGLLKAEKRGKWAYYQLNPTLRPLVEAMLNQFPDAKLNPTVKADTKRINARLALRGTQQCGPGKYRAFPPAHNMFKASITAKKKSL
jgi:ArsR family transcriptional regulator